MSSRNNGGPAFPRSGWESEYSSAHDTFPQDGMTLRDYFAAKALPSMLSSSIPDAAGMQADFHEWATLIADASYKVADAMLKARGL